MSLWGLPKLAPNAFLIIDIILFSIDGCLDNISYTSLPEVIYYCTGSLAVIKRDLVKYDSNPKLIKLKAEQRIGPHNLDIISVLVGCLLGDAYAAKSKKDIPGTNFRFRQSGRHKDYLFYLYNFFYTRGYCTNSGPRGYKTTLINAAVPNKKTKTYYGYEFDVFTFSSLN